MECAKLFSLVLAPRTAGSKRIRPWRRPRFILCLAGPRHLPTRPPVSRFSAACQTGDLSISGRRTSHLDLLDYKPEMKGRFDQDIPASIFGTQRITGMVAQQDRFPVVPTMYGFRQYGEERHVAQRIAAAHRQDRRRDLRAARR